MTILSLSTNWNESAYALDRCQQYVHGVRTQHFKYFGLNFPYWYGVGQLKQESRCRANATAFDGGKGLAQFMPATESAAEKYLGELDMYNPVHAIKAQAWYMAQIDKGNWGKVLWLTYCFYNSGSGTMRKEYKRAGKLDYELMRLLCVRRIIVLKSGELLDLCDVGYLYPKQIYKYGQSYRQGQDSRRYW